LRKVTGQLKSTEEQAEKEIHRKMSVTPTLALTLGEGKLKTQRKSKSDVPEGRLATPAKV
jgi:hypothetical protein